MSNKILPINTISLERFPITKDISLKAWNAADEYLIEQMSCNILENNNKILVVNDQFGALCCSLSHYHLYYWVDSFLSKNAIQNNFKKNGLTPTATHVEQCERHIPKDIIFDWIIIKIPKHNSLLKYQLQIIRQHTHSNTRIIAAGMSKEIHKSNLNLFESILGPTKTSLAKKKARLIFSTIKSQENINEMIQNFDVDTILNNCSSRYQLEQYGLTVFGLPGVFSRNSLDIGSRVLIQSMPKTNSDQTLIDLGCGTGILGTYAAKQNPELQVTFTDESWLSVECARKTFQENIKGVAIFKTTNVLDGLKDNHYDYILCNPPFHQQNVQTLAIANKMFKDSALKLNSSGELRVVANRHLKYQTHLKRYFNKVKIISNDPKFIVWLATKPKKIHFS